MANFVFRFYNSCFLRAKAATAFGAS